MSEQNKLQGTGEKAGKDPSETHTVSLMNSNSSFIQFLFVSKNNVISNA